MSDSLVMETLLEMKSQLGEIHGTMKALDEKLDKHVSDDSKVADRVTSLEHSRTKVRAWGAAGVGAAGVLAWIVERAVDWISGK